MGANIDVLMFYACETKKRGFSRRSLCIINGICTGVLAHRRIG